MVANIIVAVACNLVAVLILLSGIFSAKRNGLKVTLVKLFMSLGGVVGAYFLTPSLSSKLCGVEKVPELFSQIGISRGSLNSCIFMLFFLFVYAFTLIVCSFVKHAQIKKFQDKKLNKIKLKRARSINPRAEKAVKRAEWKAAKLRFREKRRWYHKVLSFFVGVIISVILGIVTLMPFGYIFKDIQAKTGKDYLVNGFEYTLNGVINESFFDWAVHNKEDVPVVEEEQQGSETEETVEPEVPVEPETEVETESSSEE